MSNPQPPESQPPIRAITFDIGGTLLKPARPVGETYAEVARAHGVGVDAKETNNCFMQSFKANEGFRAHAGVSEASEREKWRAIVETCLGSGVPSAQLDAIFDELFQAFARASAWSPLCPETKELLKALQNKGFRLGVISNFDKRLYQILGELGWLEVFDAVIISSEVGRPKPHPRIFQAAATALALQPAQILHIGDSDEADIKGARSAGFRAAKIDPQALDELLLPFLRE